MIAHIMELLSSSNGQTENIRIAQGKYKHPESIREAIKKFKKELIWQKRSQ